jgi:hypothetical protein
MLPQNRRDVLMGAPPRVAHVESGMVSELNMTASELARHTVQHMLKHYAQRTHHVHVQGSESM